MFKSNPASNVFIRVRVRDREMKKGKRVGSSFWQVTSDSCCHWRSLLILLIVLPMPCKKLGSSFYPSDNLPVHLCIFDDRRIRWKLLRWKDRWQCQPTAPGRKWKSTKIQKCKNTKIQNYKNTKMTARWQCQSSAPGRRWCVVPYHVLSVLQNIHQQKYTLTKLIFFHTASARRYTYT